MFGKKKKKETTPEVKVEETVDKKKEEKKSKEAEKKAKETQKRIDAFKESFAKLNNKPSYTKQELKAIGSSCLRGDEARLGVFLEVVSKQNSMNTKQIVDLIRSL